MARFVNFEEARAFAARTDRLGPDHLVRALGATPAAAAALMRRLQQEGMIGPADEKGEHPVLGGLARRRSWSNAEPGDAPAEARLALLQAELARLRLQAEDAQAWRRRALEAEARLAAAERSGPSRAELHVRIAALRRMLAKELHPDGSHAVGADREVHAEIFKAVWPRVEAVLRGEPGADPAAEG